MSHDRILTKLFVAFKAWDAGDADRGIARVNCAERTRAILAHTYGINFWLRTFSTSGRYYNKKGFAKPPPIIWDVVHNFFEKCRARARGAGTQHQAAGQPSLKVLCCSSNGEEDVLEQGRFVTPLAA